MESYSLSVQIYLLIGLKILKYCFFSLRFDLHKMLPQMNINTLSFYHIPESIFLHAKITPSELRY